MMPSPRLLSFNEIIEGLKHPIFPLLVPLVNLQHSYKGVPWYPNRNHEKDSNHITDSIPISVWKSLFTGYKPVYDLCGLRQDHVCFKGCIYWRPLDYSRCEYPNVIFSFDLKSEEFSKVRLPDLKLKNPPRDISMVLGLVKNMVCQVWVSFLDDDVGREKKRHHKSDLSCLKNVRFDPFGDITGGSSLGGRAEDILARSCGFLEHKFIHIGV
ncbi:hypothetical protein Tco_1437840 [Tanacetum coccineum]